MPLASRVAAALLIGTLTACGADADEEPGKTLAQESPVDQHSPALASGRLPVPAIDLARVAAPATSEGRTTCHGIVGSLADPDPAGRVVRAAPRSDAPELGRIPPPAPTEEWGDFPFEFDITGSENGWLRIANAGFDEQLAGKSRAKAYSGEGWIAGGGVFVKVQSRTGFAQPSHASAVLLSGYPDFDFDGLQAVRVVGCTGRWVLQDWPAEASSSDGRRTWRLRYRPEAVVQETPLLLRAWTAGVCNIAETTCDSVDGDFAETSRLDAND